MKFTTKDALTMIRSRIYDDPKYADLRVIIDTALTAPPSPAPDGHEIVKLREKLSTMRDERDALKIRAKNYADISHEWRRRAEAAEARVKALEEATGRVLRWVEPIAGDNICDKEAAKEEEESVAELRALLDKPGGE